MTQDERFKIIKTISYSGLVDFSNCGKYYELVHVQRLKVFKSSPDTYFGTLLHKYCQLVLQDKMKTSEAAEKFVKIWDRFYTWFKIDPKYKHLSKVGEKVILYIKGYLKNKFGNHQVKHIEYRIKHKLEQFPQDFKGFIDLVLELQNGDIVIIDIKTAGSLYFFEKYRDKIKDYQITLYKKYYSELEKINLDKITTHFIVFEKNIESKNPISLITVGSGDVKVENAEKWLFTSLSYINKNRFIKNRLSCLKYGKDYPCAFYKTESCS